MGSIAVMILSALSMQIALTLAATQDSMDEKTDGMVDNLIGRSLTASSDDHAHLDETMLGKTAHALNLGTSSQASLTRAAPASQFRGMASPVSAMQGSLRKYGIPESSMEKLALTTLAATRDVSMRAQVRQVLASSDRKTQVRVAEVAKEVELKAEDLVGINPPTGFFDPLGFSKDAGAGTILFLREAELKHGRVGMIASLGIIVSEVFHPFFGGLPDGKAVTLDILKGTPNAALHDFWVSVFLVCGGLEIAANLSPNTPYEKFSGYEIKPGWTPSSSQLPGDLGYDPLGLKPKDAKEFKELQNKELNNGRLAMLGAAGIIAQELLTGKAAIR